MKYNPSDKIPQEELPEGANYQLANSFRNFLWKVWAELGFPAPTENQYAIADYLQYGGSKLQLIAFRGIAKSYITVPFCVWLMYRDPSVQVLTTSATKDLADDNARFAWTMINTFDWLRHMVPGKDQSSSYSDFDVKGAKPAKGTSFAARGIFGQITGLRADIAVVDDGETPNTSETPGARARLRRRVSEIGGAILKPDGIVVFLGTPQCEETIYRDNEAIGYRTCIIPIHYPTEKEITRYGEHRLAPHILAGVRSNPALAGTTTEPTRFTELDIEGRRIEFGRSEFERQFKMFMDAGSGDGTPLKLRDLIILPMKPFSGQPGDGTGVPGTIVPPQLTDDPIDHEGIGVFLDTMASDNKIFAPKEVSNWGKPDEIVMHIDPSGSGSDETSWAITGMKSARVFLLAAGSDIRGYEDEVLKRIAEDARRWGVNRIYVEDNLGLGMFGSLLIPHLKKIKYPCSVETERVGKAFKEKRILDIMEPLMTGNRLVVNLDVLKDDFFSADAYENVEQAKRRFYRLTYQMTRMRRLRQCLPHDDRLDALASGCLYWKDRLEQEEKEAEGEALAAYIAEQIERENYRRMSAGLPLLEQNTAGHDIDLLIEKAKAAMGTKRGSDPLSRKRRNRRR